MEIAGWEYVQNTIAKVMRSLWGEAEAEEGLSVRDNINFLVTIIDMRRQASLSNKSGIFGQEVYDLCKRTIEENIESKVHPALREKDDEFLLVELIKQWNRHKAMVKWLSEVLSKAEFLSPGRGLAPLKEVGFMSFGDVVYHKMEDRIKDAVITQMARIREGQRIDRVLLRNVVRVFMAIGIDTDKNNFEDAMLQDVASFYSTKAASWIGEQSGPKYMIKAAECLKREKEWARLCLPTSSAAKVVKTVEHHLLVPYEDQLLQDEDSGFRACLRAEKVAELSRIYSLFHTIPTALKFVSDIFTMHVTEEVAAIVKQSEDAASCSNNKDFVLMIKVVEFHDKYIRYVHDCFQMHSLFQKAMKQACEGYWDQCMAGSAEVLAIFFDDLLKKGGSGKLSDVANEDTLPKVGDTLAKAVQLVPYISDKDVFEELCRRKLARRLLSGSSANYDHERSMLTKLKQQFGGQITSKMERMLADMTLASENQAQFEEYLNLNENELSQPGIDLTVAVLTPGIWPSSQWSDLVLPAEMMKSVEAFTGFYRQKMQGRRLTWVSSHGSCTIVGRFEQKPIELIVSTNQAAVLLLFNYAERLSCSDIKTQLNSTLEEAVRLLHSLSCANYKLLNKEPPFESVGPNDEFEFNVKFTDKMRRIKIPLPPVLDETRTVVEDVDTDRRYAIDASLVRILKSQKVLQHPSLVSQCVEQLRCRFKPDLKMIKQRIEHLIDREYMERCTDDKMGLNINMLRYTA